MTGIKRTRSFRLSDECIQAMDDLGVQNRSMFVELAIFRMAFLLNSADDMLSGAFEQTKQAPVNRPTR